MQLWLQYHLRVHHFPCPSPPALPAGGSCIHNQRLWAEVDMGHLSFACLVSTNCQPFSWKGSSRNATHQYPETFPSLYLTHSVISPFSSDLRYSLVPRIREENSGHLRDGIQQGWGHLSMVRPMKSAWDFSPRQGRRRHAIPGTGPLPWQGH